VLACSIRQETASKGKQGTIRSKQEVICIAFQSFIHVLIFLFMNHWNIFRILILKIKTKYIMAVFPIAFLQGDAERQNNLLIMEVEALDERTQWVEVGGYKHIMKHLLLCCIYRNMAKGTNRRTKKHGYGIIVGLEHTFERYKTVFTLNDPAAPSWRQTAGPHH